MLVPSRKTSITVVFRVAQCQTRPNSYPTRKLKQQKQATPPSTGGVHKIGATMHILKETATKDQYTLKIKTSKSWFSRKTGLTKYRDENAKEFHYRNCAIAVYELTKDFKKKPYYLPLAQGIQKELTDLRGILQILDSLFLSWLKVTLFIALVIYSLIIENTIYLDVWISKILSSLFALSVIARFISKWRLRISKKESYKILNLLNAINLSDQNFNINEYRNLLQLTRKQYIREEIRIRREMKIIYPLKKQYTEEKEAILYSLNELKKKVDIAHQGKNS